VTGARSTGADLFLAQWEYDPSVMLVLCRLIEELHLRRRAHFRFG